jgi:hypothetical protein
MRDAKLGSAMEAHRDFVFGDGDIGWHVVSAMVAPTAISAVDPG